MILGDDPNGPDPDRNGPGTEPFTRVQDPVVDPTLHDGEPRWFGFKRKTVVVSGAIGGLLALITAQVIGGAVKQESRTSVPDLGNGTGGGTPTTSQQRTSIAPPPPQPSQQPHTPNTKDFGNSPTTSTADQKQLMIGSPSDVSTMLGRNGGLPPDSIPASELAGEPEEGCVAGALGQANSSIGQRISFGQGETVDMSTLGTPGNKAAQRLSEGTGQIMIEEWNQGATGTSSNGQVYNFQPGKDTLKPGVDPVTQRRGIIRRSSSGKETTLCVYDPPGIGG